jgi:hypothetical protein
MILEGCSSGEFIGFENLGSVTMKDCVFSEGLVNSYAPQYLTDNEIARTFVLSDMNQDPVRDYGLVLDQSNIQMVDALIMTSLTPAEDSDDARRIKAARTTSGSYSLDVTDPDFTNGSNRNVTIETYWYADTDCTINIYYDSTSGMKLGRTVTYTGAASPGWKTANFTVTDARFGSSQDVRIDVTGSSPGLAYVAIQSDQLPPALDGYTGWAGLFGGAGVIGSKTNDPDGDCLANLGEYAQGGNPTNGMDVGVVPELVNDGGTLRYIHVQRNDDTNLVYTLESTTNLVSGSWADTGYTMLGTNVTGLSLDYVTNSVPASGEQGYFRLRFEYP